MKKHLPILVSLCALFSLVTASSQVIACASRGLRLCAELILPSLFPFFAVSLLLAKLGFPQLLDRVLSPLVRRLFRVSGAGATALFIGLCGGYPMGAAYLAELTEQGQISPREAERLLVFSNNSGPAFLVGAIGGGVFASPRAGLLLYLSHVLAALLSGLLVSRFQKEVHAAEIRRDLSPLPFSKALGQAVGGAVPAVLQVCGFVILFTVFTGLLEANGFLPPLQRLLSSLFGLGAEQSRALLLGFWELGGGVGALRGLSPTPGNLSLAAALVGWGGLSVHLQSLAPFADLPVRTAPHLGGRLLSAGLSAGLIWLLAQ